MAKKKARYRSVNKIFFADRLHDLPGTLKSLFKFNPVARSKGDNIPVPVSYFCFPFEDIACFIIFVVPKEL